ncbi:hypothetical protein PFISCL1PPCAC_4133, partial [Pristionchus fissidentatus]
LCAICWENVKSDTDKNKSVYQCVYDNGLITQCYSEPVNNKDLTKLPKAHHISDLLGPFWKRGISCRNCIRLADGEKEKGLREFKESSLETAAEDRARRKWSFRFPRELMVCCTHEECVNKESSERAAVKNYSGIGIGSGDTTINPERCEGEFYFAVVPICMFCATSAHKEHVAYLKPIDQLRDQSTIDYVNKKWTDRRDRETVKPNFLFERKPWHLAMLKGDEMRRLTKELLVCSCGAKLITRKAALRSFSSAVISCVHPVRMKFVRRIPN